MTLIEAKKVVKQFGGITALDHLDLCVGQGEIVGLIGPNGSGKTTFFNCLTGFYKVDGGDIFFKEKKITNEPTHAIIQHGISRTFQLNRVFSHLTVLENVLLGQNHQGEGILQPFLRRSEEKVIERSLELLHFVNLFDKREDLAGSLSYGQQKLLDLAIALVKEPELLLLDEPTAGVNPTLINDIVDRILQINHQGTTILLIEHNMDVIMNISQRIYVLSFGEKIAEGIPEVVREDPNVLEVYFGK
jgi:ABC-type branched-subunit amino acid transport system ATPase component